VDKLDLELEYAMVQATTTQDTISIDSKVLSNSNLVAKLNGLGSTSVFVRRFDARRLLDDVSTELLGQVILENPKAFTEKLLSDLLLRHSERMNATAEKFEATKWQSTYNGADLQVVS
jgi:hypothetical protein